MQELRFSQQLRMKMQHSACYAVTTGKYDVSKESKAFIFFLDCLTLKVSTLCSFETSVSTYPPREVISQETLQYLHEHTGFASAQITQNSVWPTGYCGDTHPLCIALPCRRHHTAVSNISSIRRAIN